MEFWTFFGGTLLGKAFALRPMQTAGFVAIFSKQFRPRLIKTIGAVVPVIGTPAAAFASEKIDGFVASVESGGNKTTGEPGLAAKAWGLTITLLILYFIKTSLELFAQQYAKDEAKKDKKH